jgi:Ca-activated chloride channel family protein
VRARARARLSPALALLALGVLLLWACAGSPKEAFLTEPGASSAPAGAKPAAPAAENAAKAAAPTGAPAAAEIAPEAAPEQAPAGQRGATQGGITRYLSADDSNSAASPVIARRLIEQGRYVQPAVVRTYEFLNYYSFEYPAPAEAPVAVYAQMRRLGEEDLEGVGLEAATGGQARPQGAGGDGPPPGLRAYSLQVAVRGPERTLAELPPLNLTFLVDSSGSMVGPPLELARELVLGIAGRLRPDDRLSVAACNRGAWVLVEGLRAGDPAAQEQLGKALAGLRADDVTDLQQGVLQAYDLAGAGYDYRCLNRVVVISDGAANAGELAVDTIARNARDSDRQGIYLAGIGVGEGFNDALMNAFTDKGRGAYLFLDGEGEITRLLEERAFVAAFDLAVKDVRLKMVMPPGWQVVEFHGEQISERAAEVTPQYLSSNDQMIYHLKLATALAPEEALGQSFQFEAEFTPLGGRPGRVSVQPTVAEMLSGAQPGAVGAAAPAAAGSPAATVPPEILKGDAVVAYAEMLKRIGYPLEQHREENLAAWSRASEEVQLALEATQDRELAEIAALLERYGRTLREGEQLAGARDRDSQAPEAVLGLDQGSVRRVTLEGPYPHLAVMAMTGLGSSTRLRPLEGYRFLGLSSGPVGNPSPAGSGELSDRPYPDPMPEYMGWRKIRQRRGVEVYDLHQVRLELTAPPGARSFSFDFDFFSAEYPEYVNQEFNDTFYAILEAPSTNGGRPTNIAFDANGRSIEVDNNYFENPFHPIPNAGTGFDAHGSSGWLHTSWPVRGGEQLALTFSIHDEGDAIFDSLVLLDNFQWHGYDAVGTTDPLN